ncbi:DUF72 domain-containing protein [Sinomonas humi]|uniref:DUF72 domain-containing protein n=1 Tax=Sinomonas humi TaxID=1338436 RepID=A0A0B2AEF4_9MICC|nr:DUF72 domain-containing protein [Sinomonas humi]KHL01909.1 hypothetical protein LK10_14185 [Sinomonas humi]
MATAYIGVSGWRYSSWRGDFYPRGLRQKDELAYAAERMSSVELNGSFYSLQRPSSYEAWRDATPEGFVFAVKGGRFITHMKQLRDVEAAFANFFASGVLALGGKLGPILWQLPERMAFDEDTLSGFFDLLPRTASSAAALAHRHDEKVPEQRAFLDVLAEVPLRHALEPRHESFDTPAARAFLAEREICTVIADSAGRWPVLHDETAHFRYVRLHGETRLYGGGYAEASLDEWAERVRAWLDGGFDTYVYFDNDADGRAPHDAVNLLARLA